MLYNMRAYILATRIPKGSLFKYYYPKIIGLLPPNRIPIIKAPV